MSTSYSEVLSPESIDQLPNQAEVSADACRHTERLTTHLWPVVTAAYAHAMRSVADDLRDELQEEVLRLPSKCMSDLIE